MVPNAKVCMLEVLLIRPGATTFDEDGRIKGSLDIPLSPQESNKQRLLRRASVV